jgi:hypothetical protein
MLGPAHGRGLPSGPDSKALAIEKVVTEVFSLISESVRSTISCSSFRVIFSWSRSAR